MSNPDGENSLFGYSYSANSNSVLVGAPLHSGGTGSLFECTLDTEQCIPIISNDVASGSEHSFIKVYLDVGQIMKRFKSQS